VAGDRAQADSGACGIPRVPARDPGEPRQRVDMGDIKSPREQLDERGSCRPRDTPRGVRPQHGHARAAGVEPLGVGAHDIPGDTAAAAREHLAVLVD
jgi:hypothetical protein